MAKRKPKKIDRIKISACYMVKNAAEDLPLSLQSIKGFVDEIIVVDTGSTDETVAIAKKFGAKIFHVPWQDDFSTPRNVALREAKGDWIVFLDADEYFVNDTAKNLQRAIKLAKQSKIPGLAVNWVNVDKDNDNKVINSAHVLRVFMNAPDVRYVGKIHEDVFQGDEPMQRAMTPADLLTLYHTGYSKTIIRSKLERNLKLLLEELAESDKPERTYAYLVDCYYGLEDFANAEKFARLDLKVRHNPANRPIRILIEILEKDPSRFDECFEVTKLAVERYPTVPEFSAKLAECFSQQKNYRAAVDEMRRAIDKAANYGEQFESTNFDADKIEHARQLIDEWLPKISLTPDEKRREVARVLAELIKGVEVLHDRKKNLQLAETLFALKPDDAEPVERAAMVFIDYEVADKAETVVDYMEEKFPPSARRLMLHARACFLKKNIPDTIKFAERALALNDGDLITMMTTINLLGQIYRYIGDARKAIEYYRRNAKLDLSAFKNSPQYESADTIRREDYSNLLFNLHNINVSREELFKEACGFNKLLEHIPRFSHNRKRHARHKKIRIGYISPDVRFHVVAFFSSHFFMSYDKMRFEVFIYANNPADNNTEQFAANVDGFRNILHQSARAVANQIVADEIDILVDLTGHTSGNSLDVMAYKPAPIQISGIGYFDTTGLDTIDYFIADKFTDPEGLNENFFTEKFLRLQHSHFCYTWHDLAHYVTPAPCTQKGYVTFASFNNFTKVTDEMLKLWAKILDGVPNSRLYLKAKIFKESYGSELVRKRIKAAGIDLDRVDCEPFEVDYIRYYERVDIALDTFPYPGGGTTCDALYMGVPVITLVGERHNSRFGYSLLMNIGLEELCAFNADEYVQKAIDLANDRERLRDYHLTLRRRMEESPVMKDMIYMGELELAYEKIFSAWLADKPLPNFPQEPEPLTESQAEEYYRRALSYLPLEGKNGTSKFNRVDFKRTLYFAELAAQVESQRDARLLLTIADRRFMLDDNNGAYSAMCKAIEYIYSPQGAAKNYDSYFVAECHSKLAKFAQNVRHYVESVEHYNRAFEICQKPARCLEFYDAVLLGLHFLDISSEELAEPHFEYQKLFEGVEPFTTYHKPHDRIKVAYISGDFRQHAAFAVVFGFISCHDRTKFEITCYSKNPDDDKYTDLYRRGVEHFIDVQGMSDDDLAKKIHDDEIDVAFDLAGHTGCNALPALIYRPAPVQICGIGYMSTTGLDAIDYFITDAVLDPPGEHEKFFSEKLLYMPAQFSYARRENVPTVDGAPCMKNGYVTFGTICRYTKITDDMLVIWTEILRRVPNAKLLMRAQEYISNNVVDVLYEKLKGFGCDMDRVIFRPAVHDYFGAISAVDIILDAYPYVGGATTLDALYMGVPVINLYGERHSTRFGKSILHSIGLEDLSVDNAAAYVNTAVALANDPETLDLLHKNLRNMFLQSDALDPMKYCRLLEKKFMELVNAALS